MATNNAINLKTAGIVTYDGAGTFGADTTTNHNVLIGAASNGITNVAPSATSGVPLISQGASVDPTFGTAVVSGGGTGNTTFTAYSVITAGTTATGAFQNVSGLGTSGQVLASNGSGALPTWQTVPSGVFSPNATINIQDDFIAGNGSNGINSEQGWVQVSSGSSSVSHTTIDNAHPGCILFSSGAATNSILGQGGIQVGGGAITVNWVFKITTLSGATNRYILRFGLGDTTTTSDQSNGIYFEYSDNVNSGNWVYATAAASTRTKTNSSTAVGTGWHNAQLSVNAAGTSVSFTVDGVSLGTANTTNIPSATVNPLFYINGTAGTGPGSNNIYADLFYMTQILTTAR